ncbi:hypothetical protein GQ600_23202 [Phytophthora cactorum]|nr:hypothetical protein GQ600_23202 [Phytophthora cactorum]
MLSVFACLYLWLIVFMLSYNSESTVNNLSQAPDPKSLSYRLSQKLLPFLRRLQAQTGGVPRQRTASIGNASSRVRSLENLKSFSAKIQRTSSFGSHAASKLIFDFTSMEGTYHRYYVNDEPYDVSKQRLPSANYLFLRAATRFQLAHLILQISADQTRPMLVVARVFYLVSNMANVNYTNCYTCRFDLFFAVFAPIVMLMYSYYNFHVDRDNFVIREETLTPAALTESHGSLPTRSRFNLLKRITEGEYILVKCFLNLLGIYKWKKVIAYLILANRSRREDKGVAKARAHPHSRKHTMYGDRYLHSTFHLNEHRELCTISTLSGLLLSLDWGHKSTCRCIVFMDLDLAPRTYNDWINAPDVTEDLRALSSNGYLQIVQIINRAVPELPEELRLCTKLKRADSCLHEDAKIS